MQCSAELSVLHELSGFAFTESEEQLSSEAVEKVTRIFGVRCFGVVSRDLHQQRLTAAWGISSLEQALAKLEQCADHPGFLKLVFNEGTEDQDIIFFEQARPLSDRDCRLYRVFARRLADRLTAFRLRAKNRQAMEALVESEKMLRESQETAGIGSYVVDLVEETCTNSPVLNKLLGIARQEKHPLTEWTSLIHPEWSGMVMQARKSAMEKDGRFAQEYKIIRKDDGLERWVDDVGRFESDDLGRPVKLVGTIRDVTERKQAEEALKENEARLRGITDSTLDAVVMIDHQGLVSFWNPAAEKIFGYRAEEAIGQELHHLLAPPRYHAAYRSAFPEFQRTGKGQAVGRTIELTARRKDGQERLVSLSLSALELKGRWHAVGIVRDITERKIMEQERERFRDQLLQAQKMKILDTLAGGVAHDFNNLLQVMGGNLQLLLQSTSQDRPDAVRLKTLERNVERASQLVRQLLLFSRKAEVQLKRVNLNMEIRETAEMLKRAIPKMITVVLRLEGRPWPIRADPVQIEQVLLNLASNAADAMPDGGRLVMETANVNLEPEFARKHLDLAPGPYVLMSISDTGYGMDKAVVEHIFEPFFTTKEVGKGTGLGLSTVYGIVKEHGGHILCYSEPKLGTTFKIYWPALPSEGEFECSAVPETADQLSGSEIILVVDDEADILELTAEVLTSRGYTVLTATSGEEALAVYAGKTRSIDMVVLDMNMPGMGGRQCLEELLALDPEARVLVVSGYSEPGRIREILEAGAVGFIGKPYQLAELTAKMRDVLGRR